MGKNALSWLTAVVTAVGMGAIAALVNATQHGPDLGDPWLTGVVAGAIKKIVDYIVSKSGPAHPPSTPTNTIR
jgi:hypothetical protein